MLSAGRVVSVYYELHWQVSRVPEIEGHRVRSTRPGGTLRNGKDVQVAVVLLPCVGDYLDNIESIIDALEE